MKIKNYREHQTELEVTKLLESMNESFGFESIYDYIKKFVTNLFKVSSNPFESIKSLWKKIRSNEKYCYILISILTITCGIPKVELLKNLDNDPKVIQIADQVEKDNSEQKTHIVKKGESLLSISKLYDMYYTDLIHKNKLRSTTIQPGQVLLIPNQSERDIYNLEQKPADFEEIQFGKPTKSEIKHPKPKEAQKPKEKELPKANLENGFFIHSLIVNKRLPRLEIAPFKKVNAIVLHRTATTNTESTINRFSDSRIGTHFLIDYDGTIYQTAGIDKITYHVGEIRSRAAVERKASKEEKEILKEIGWSPKRIHYHEITKSYPERYPHNSDAIGIEVMGGYNSGDKKWENLTPEQIKSCRFLVKTLKENLGLTDKDIYAHEQISYKTHDEGGFILKFIE